MPLASASTLGESPRASDKAVEAESGVGSPGRFFAANELKSMMAHLVMNYDVRMEKAGEVPAPIHYTAMISPNRTAKVLFRKRQD